MTETNATENVKMPLGAKLTVETLFYVDFDWWKSHDHNWRISLNGYLCETHKKLFSDQTGGELIDLVDPQSGAVSKKDIFFEVLTNHCAKQEGFIPQNGALTDLVFRVFLANGNKPLNTLQIGKIINRPPETILRTLTGSRTYRGIRPIQL